ncbi:MAG: carbonic anhydrase [Cyanobacteria bacterium J06627_8]
MKKLIKGLHQFQADYFARHQEIFEQLAHDQNPRVLFIACSDSRVDPNLITQSQVGDIFVIRNAGNIIPPFGAANGGEGAAVEYALHALNIEHIVVCGHSNCGAMKGLLKLEKLESDMPLVHEWLQHAEATRRLIVENYGDRTGDDLIETTVAENVLTQLENLKTYPIIHSRLFAGTLTLHAWVYHIETGDVHAYDPISHSYLPPQNLVSNYEPEESDAPPFNFPGARWLSPEQSERIYRGSATH